MSQPDKIYAHTHKTRSAHARILDDYEKCELKLIINDIKVNIDFPLLVGLLSSVQYRRTQIRNTYIENLISLFYTALAISKRQLLQLRYKESLIKLFKNKRTKKKKYRIKTKKMHNNSHKSWSAQLNARQSLSPTFQLELERK